MVERTARALEIGVTGSREIAAFVGPMGRIESNWRTMGLAKLRELDERVQGIQQAQKALHHLLACRDDRLDDCPEHHRILRAHAELLADADHRRR